MNISNKLPIGEKFRAARENESIFRAILRDIKGRYPGFVPETIDPDADIESLLNLFTPLFASRGFGIGEFEVGPESSDKTELKLHSKNLTENEAVIEIHNFQILSGSNIILLYDTTSNQPVQFKGETPGIKMIS